MWKNFQSLIRVADENNITPEGAAGKRELFTVGRIGEVKVESDSNFVI